MAFMRESCAQSPKVLAAERLHAEDRAQAARAGQRQQVAVAGHQGPRPAGDGEVKECRVERIAAARHHGWRTGISTAATHGMKSASNSD